MSIEKLKEQARRHEQKEEWRKALDQYAKAIDRLEEDDQHDIGLYNRVGDLFVRVGNLEEAVEHYEQAVDLYMEAYLPNNAIAVCKKIVRNVPQRPKAYLRMGQIRAEQGFMPDARTNFLTYAERVAQDGDMEESLRALVEFTELAPDDVQVRLFLAEQLASQDREEEAVAHLVAAYQVLKDAGDQEQAGEVEERIRELDPSADLSVAPVARAPADDGGAFSSFGEISLEEDGSADAMADAAEEAAGSTDGADEDDGGIEMDDFAITVAEDDEATAAEVADLDHEETADTIDEEEGSFYLASDADEEDQADAEVEEDHGSSMGEEDDGWGDEATELPMMDVDFDEDDGFVGATDDPEDAADEGQSDVWNDDASHDEEDDEDDGWGENGTELPLMDVDYGDEEEDDEDDLPLMEVEYDDDEAEDVDSGLADLDSVDQAAEAAEDSLTQEVAEAPGELTPHEVRARLASDPHDVSLHQRMVELAYVSGAEEDLVEAYTGLARALEWQNAPGRARAAWQQVLDADPGNADARAALEDDDLPTEPAQEVAANEDYVDLGSMILGGQEEKTTRFTVAYEEPTGDEEADFAKMLSQFKEKVSENLGADDVSAHHDLGTAYKEMGLLDEAVSEFQSALRADPGHLPTYELIGQTFLEMDHPDQAVRSLQRALKVDYGVEDELLGIYYYLARAYEERGNTEEALEFYDRVFSLDINFADVTERLRTLRPA